MDGWICWPVDSLVHVQVEGCRTLKGRGAPMRGPGLLCVPTWEHGQRGRGPGGLAGRELERPCLFLPLAASR